MTDYLKPPRLIALCGRPGSGKSEAASLISKRYGHMVADDGGPLRDIAMRYLGATSRQVFTQAGKLETISIAGNDWQVRKALGDLGKAFEATFGEHIMPAMCAADQKPDHSYVMASVRRTQGHFWAAQGAVVLEVRAPGVPESPYDFDQFDPTAVQGVIENDPNKGLDYLEAQIDVALKPFMRG